MTRVWSGTSPNETRVMNGTPGIQGSAREMDPGLRPAGMTARGTGGSDGAWLIDCKADGEGECYESGAPDMNHWLIRTRFVPDNSPPHSPLKLAKIRLVV
jgi:hypothetical protein